MKKLLLSLLAVAGMTVAANAESAILKFGADYNSKSVNAYTVTWTATNGGITWTLVNFNNNQNGWSYVKCGRKDNESVATITNNVAFTNAVTDVTITIGAITAAKVNSIVLTTSATADFSTVIEEKEFKKATGEQKVSLDKAQTNLFYKLTFDCASGSSNGLVQVNQVEYTYGEAYDPSDTRQPAEISYETAKLSIFANDAESFVGQELVNPNNLTVTYESSDENIAEVDATTGVVTLNGDAGTATITATFAGNTEYKAGTASYTITVKEALPVVNSIAETLALESKTDIKVGYALTVGFVNGNNVFVCDEAGDFIQIYGVNSCHIGDVIPAGWAAQYTVYIPSGQTVGTPELIPADGLPAVTEGSFTPKAVAYEDITAASVNSVVLLENVEFAAATPAGKENFTGTIGETEVALRNNYALASVEAGTYNVTVLVTLYNGAPSLYVTNYASTVEAGFADITVDAAAPAVYYNLQGVEVANPQGGIFIVRQGNKVSKVVK